ncbi:hypothetical protein EP47_14465 [Legionella norrlandica]|uniref:Uncharacterized protein n=1 Tax=Legionella norrlandica TaxID=1498499 RepID=A0A0A2SNY8_9GAMM|nr:hypothetical protein [Legionella norrlandica]KGP62467.1 hypothetical protein EP47_14465 [Legionella norrlandica]
MNSTATGTISAIIENEEELEVAITQLIAESVARADISVQGSPEQLKEKYGDRFVAPEIIQESKHPPVREPYLKDDFNWIVGFSFSIPLFICLSIGIFIIGDVRSAFDIFLYGILGAIVGSIIGYIISSKIKNTHDKRIEKQEKKGGFVLWVTTHSQQQQEQVIKILKKYHPEHIIRG